jgi:hypothetical protein
MTRAALFVAALSALTLMWRSPSRGQRTIATTLWALLAIDVLRSFSRSFRDAPPYVGLDRAAWAVDGAGLLAWYALTAIAVGGVLTPRRSNAWAAWVAVGLAVAPCLFAAYPMVRGAPFLSLVGAAKATSAAALLLGTIRFLSRGRAPDDAQRVALALAASTWCDVAGAWWYGDPVAHWPIGQLQALVTWAAVAAWEGRCLIRAR